MNDADQIAREIINDCLQQLDNRLAPKIVERRVAAALTAAHTAGFNEAKGRAVEVANGWLIVFEDIKEIEHISPKQYASDAVKDIADGIAALQEGKDAPTG